VNSASANESAVDGKINFNATSKGKLPITAKSAIRRRRSTASRILRLAWSSASGRSTVVICLLAMLCTSAAVLLTGRSAGLAIDGAIQTTDDAYVHADQIAISSHVAGYVDSVPVRDNERVRKGQTIAIIRDEDYQAALSSATADLSAAASAVDILVAQVSLQNSRIAAAEASVKATEADLYQQRLELARQTTLVATSDSPHTNLEKAQAGSGRLVAQRDANLADVAAARQMLDVLAHQIAQAQAAVKVKQAAIDLARIELGYTRILSPVDGQLSARMVFGGEYVTPGTQIGLVVPLPNVWVVANFRETQIAHMQPGQAASVTVDSVPDETFRGTVDSFGPVSGGLQALLPPDNATGNFTKVAQRFAVKISLAPDQPGLDRLRPGMSVIASVATSSAAKEKSQTP
jgi:membrane fusion protein, multidrug efflux system